MTQEDLFWTHKFSDVDWTITEHSIKQAYEESGANMTMPMGGAFNKGNQNCGNCEYYDAEAVECKISEEVLAHPEIDIHVYSYWVRNPQKHNNCPEHPYSKPS